VRDRQFRRFDRDVVVEQDVDVECPWTPTHGALTQRGGLDALASTHEGERIETGLDDGHD
jgi:hypothetical protein